MQTSNLDDVVERAIGHRMLDLFDIDFTIASRWGEGGALKHLRRRCARSLPDVS